MAKQKKEKQIPIKQQMYEQMITSQLYGDQSPTSQANLDKIQKTYDEWQNTKATTAKIQEHYNAWLDERKKAKEATSVPKETQKSVEATTAPKATKKAVEPKEKKKYLTHSDVMSELNKRSVDATNYPEMASLEQGGTVDLFNRPKVNTSELKKAGWKDAGDGEATVFSSTYTNTKGDKAGNFTPIVTDAKGNYLRTLSDAELTKYAEAVLDGKKKDTLKLQIGKTHGGKKAIDNAVSAAKRVHELQEDYYMNPRKSKADEAFKKKDVVGGSVKQLDLSKYNLPNTGITEEDFALEKTKIKGKNQKKGAVPKKSVAESAARGAAKTPFRVSKFLADASADVYQSLAEPTAQIVDELTGSGFDNRARVREKADALRARLNKNYADLRREEETAKAQHPGAFGAGNAATQLAMYYVTNPVFDSIGKGLGVTSKAGRFALNQLGQNAQDIVLDIIPTLAEMMEDGKITKEEGNELAKQGAFDAFTNLAIPGAQYGLGKSEQALYESLGKSVGNNADVLKSMDATGAVRDIKNATKQIPKFDTPSVLPSEELARLNTNPIEANNRQFSELMNDYNSQFKDDSAMKNIFTPEDLNASQNRQLAELMDEYRARSAVNDLAGNVAEPASKNAILEFRGPDEAIGETANAINPTPSTLKLSDEVWDKLDSRFTEIAELTNKVQRSKIMDTVTDEKALKEWAAVNEAYSNYLNKAMFDGTIEETEAAKKALDAARKRYSRAMKDINPEIAKEFNSGTYGKQIGRPVYDRNVKNFEDSSQEATDLINALENTESAAKNSPNTTKPAAKTQQITIENEKEFRKDINSLKASFRAKTRWIKDADNKFAKKFIQSADDFLKKPSTENYAKLIKDHNNYIANAKPNAVMTNWSGTKYKPQYRSEEITSALDNLAKKYGIENFSDVKPENPISIDTKGKRPYAENQGVSPMIENEAKRLADAMDAEELIESNAKSVGQSMDNATRKVPGAEPLQFFGNKGNESKWETSKFRTNTAEKQGWGESMPIEHYAYRVFPEQEQRELAAQRYKNSDNVTKELLGKNYNEFDAADIKASIDEIKKYEAAGDVQSLRQADRLGQKMSTVQRENARVVQASAELNKNSFAGALSDAHTVSDDIVEIWGTKNKKKLDGNSRIAKALADMGYKKPNGKAAVPLTHEEVKKGVIAELEREVGSVNEHFNDNDIEYLTILAENKSIPIWQITSEIEHKLNTGNWYSLDESLPIPRPTNRKLMNALNSLVNEQVRVEKQALSLGEITEEVRNTLAKESANFEGKFGEDDVQYLANLIHEGASKDDLIKALNTKLATGKWGISDETLQEVNNIFKEISRFDENSKPFVEGQLEAYRLLAEDILPDKATPREIFETWRYLAMLGNPKTMIRNRIGNDTFNVVTGISNNIAAIAEAGIDKAMKAAGGNGIQRTKSVLNPAADSSLIKTCAEDADISRYRQLIGSKYEKMDKNALRKAKSVFNSKLLKLYEKATNAGINDYSAAKRKYSTSLAGYLKANGLDESIFKAEDELQRLKNLGDTKLLTNAEKARIEELTDNVAKLNKARDYAVKQAEYATFHEDNKIANTIAEWSKISREKGTGIGSILIEGQVPFKTATANILKSGVEYSPLGAIDSIRRTGKLVYENTGKRAGNLADVYKNSKGKEITKELASDVIESWAKTLTGTGLTALGFYLYNKGILHLSEPDTKYQDQLEGHQNYAIEINGKSYTIDWAAPSVMPLTVGAEAARLWDSTGKGIDDFYNNINTYVEAANRLTDPMIEMSMLQGIKDTLETASSYARNDEAMNILPLLGYNIGMGYISQGIPTASGQIARTIDNTRRSTYTDKEGVAGVIDKQLKKQMNKIPGLSTLNEPYVDTYGREQNNGPSDNAGINLAYQMLSPGYLSDINETKADKMSREAYEVEKNASTLPKWQSSFKDSKDNRVSPKKYTKASKAYGKAEYDIRDAFAKDKWFSSLKPEEKESIVKDINSIAMKVGKNAIEPSYNPDDAAYQAYKSGKAKGLIEYTHRKFLNSKYDVSDSAGAQAVLDKYGEKGLQNYSKVKKALRGSQEKAKIKSAIDSSLPTLSKNEKAIYYSYIDPDAKPGANPYGYVAGINYKPEKDPTYQKAKGVIPNLTPEKFYETRDVIDKWGDESRGKSYGNGNISEDEMIPYLNANAKNLAEAQSIYAAYGNPGTNKKGVTKHVVQRGGKYDLSY